MNEENKPQQSVKKGFFKERLRRLRVGFKKRLLKFSIVSLIGLGVNLLAVFLSRLLIDSLFPSLSLEYQFLIFTFTIRDVLAVTVGIAFATATNFTLNKYWTFGQAKPENTLLQFLKYAIVGGSGALVNYGFTFAFNTGFKLLLPETAAVLLANAFAFILSVIWNYFWNEIWTFNVVEEPTEEPIIVPQDMVYDEFTLITPTFNENENIGQLVEVITTSYPEMTIIVADDGSKDGTREQVQAFHKTNPRVILLDREAEEVHGLTISVIDALKMTTTKYYIVIDCDFQHPPEKVGEIAVKLKQGYHFVIGERDEIPDWPFKRRLISWGAKTIGKFSHWLHRSATCNDVMSGFFGGEVVFSQKIIAERPKGFRPKGYKVMFELLKHSKKKEARVGRVGYIFNPRVRGESKISSKHIKEFLRSAFP